MNKYAKQILTGIVKFFIGVLVLVVLFGVVIPTTLSIFWGKDIPKVEDSDLMLPKVTLADENNMFIELDQIADNMIYEPKDINFIRTYLESDTWDTEFADEVFTKNKNLLEIWEQASEKNEFLLPTMANPRELTYKSPIIKMNRWRQTNRISLAYAIWLAHIDKNQAAMNQAMQSIKIGDAMIKSQNNLMGYLVGLATKDSALDAIQKIITMTNGKGINKQDLLANLNKYNNKNKSYSYFKSEYIKTKNIFQELGNSKHSDYINNKIKYTVTNNFYFKPNLTTSYFTNYYRQIINNAQNPCKKHMMIVDEVNFNPSSVWDFVKLYITENAVGKLLASLPYTSLNNVLTKTCEIQTKQQETYEMIEKL